MTKPTTEKTTYYCYDCCPDNYENCCECKLDVVPDNCLVGNDDARWTTNNPAKQAEIDDLAAYERKMGRYGKE